MFGRKVTNQKHFTTVFSLPFDFEIKLNQLFAQGNAYGIHKFCSEIGCLKK